MIQIEEQDLTFLILEIDGGCPACIAAFLRDLFRVCPGVREPMERALRATDRGRDALEYLEFW
jgi:hypothetical protein